MTRSTSAWRRLLKFWLPAVMLCLASLALYGWQTSDSLGQAARRRSRAEELRFEIKRLSVLESQTASDSEAAIRLQEELEEIQSKVFGNLDQRLTNILREVREAPRQAGLLPGGFTYSIDEDRDLELTQFQIAFAVNGEYQQIRKMLEKLQTSPEFLIVDRIGIAGEEETMSTVLRISIQVSTYLADIDEEELRRRLRETMNG
jgi:Tfp pilus assembly protein PilO